MKAILLARHGGPDQLQPVEMEKPRPVSGEVLIKVAYCVLNPVDAASRQGRVKRPGQEPPVVLGMEYGGRVVELGEGVERSWLGKRVTSSLGRGGYSEQVAIPVEKVQLIDDRLDWKTGIAKRSCSHTAWHLLHSAGQLVSGMNVLIHSAAGAVGILATQIAKSAGARVVGLAGGEDKLQFARQFGADELIDYRQSDWVEKASAQAPGGYQLILDGVQGEAAIYNYELLGSTGQVIYFGSMSGSPAPPVDVSMIYRKGLTVTGFMLFHYQHLHTADVEEQIVDALASGKWRLPITEVAEFADIPEYHRRLQERSLCGRVLFKIGGEI